MIAIPTMHDEDAKRSKRERESLVREQTRDCQSDESSEPGSALAASMAN
jgi:hypothetical protein